jgi:hypothetical protein
MIVNTRTGGILDTAPLRRKPTYKVTRPKRRRTSKLEEMDAQSFITLTSLLVALIALTS